tara:strand:- start:236 stop:478 length:243 start_codon:yes stop_codon:yes gene_type:complete
MQVLKIIFNDFTGLVMFILPIGRVIDFSPGTLKVSLIDLLEVGIEKLLWSINSNPKNLQIFIKNFLKGLFFLDLISLIIF